MPGTRERASEWLTQALVLGRDVQRVTRSALGALKAQRAPAFELEGDARCGPLTLRYRGAEAHLLDVERLFFTGPVRRRPSLSGTVDVDVEEAFPWQVSDGRLLVVQPWLDARCQPTDAEAWFKDGVNSDVRRKIKKSQQLGLVARRTTSREDAARFYRDMLEPMARARFGEATTYGSLESFLSFNGRTASTEVVFLARDGVDVAAVSLISSPARGEVRVWAYGMLPGFLEDPKQRADLMAALNVESVKRAVAQGLALNFGFTRPFADDGVQIYKTRWGATLVPAPLVVRLAARFTTRAAQARFVAAAPLQHVTVRGVELVAPSA
jgi:hypothetical protein